MKTKIRIKHPILLKTGDHPHYRFYPAIRPCTPSEKHSSYTNINFVIWDFRRTAFLTAKPTLTNTPYVLPIVGEHERTPLQSRIDIRHILDALYKSGADHKRANGLIPTKYNAQTQDQHLQLSHITIDINRRSNTKSSGQSSAI